MSSTARPAGSGSMRFRRAAPSATRSRSGRSDATTDRRDFAARARREVRTLTCEGRRWPRGGIVATARKTRRTAGRRARGRTRPQAEPETAPAAVEEAPTPPSADVLDQPLDGLPLSVPEPALAARVPPPA